MKEIHNCPGTLASGYHTYSHTALRRVFGGKKVSHLMDFSFNDEDLSDEIAGNIQGISISGVQEKISAIIIKSKVCLTPEGQQGRYIIKPIPGYKTLRNREFIPANEHLTMQIARQVFNMPTAENALIFFKDGDPAYITKRFDVKTNGLKTLQEDFASLTAKTSASHGKDFKYSGSIEDIALTLRKYVAAWQVEMLKFYKMVIFNYLFSNGDAHLKNFSLQQTSYGDYVLSPAYDLLNTSLHVNDEDFALHDGLSLGLIKSDVYHRTSHPCFEDFINFAKLIGLNPVQTEKKTAPFLKKQATVYELTKNSFLDNKLKRMYIRCYEERLSRLLRK